MFHDVRFPDEISYGSKGGPKFKTSVITLASGKERRNIDWRNARAEYDVAHGIKNREQMEELRSFFYARMGMAYSFRFKDHADYELINEPIGTGDGTTAVFQLRKQYESGPGTYIRNITKPVVGTLQGLLVNGVLRLETTHWTCDYATGLITFKDGFIPLAGELITMSSAEYDVHCRFDTDHMDAEHDFWMTESWSTIMIVEIKE